jgi:hypothetical protein
LQRGFVKLYRKIEDSGVFQNHHATTLFMWLLVKAKWKERRENGVTLLPGEVMTSAPKIMLELGMTRKQTRMAIDFLENLQIVAYDRAHGRARTETIFKLVNWDKYQNEKQNWASDTASSGATSGPEVGPSNSNRKKLSIEADRNFDSFWQAYPKKQSKGQALKAWAKLEASLYPVIMLSIEAHKKTEGWTNQEGKFIPNPATWLNALGWENEIKLPESRKLTVSL